MTIAAKRWFGSRRFIAAAGLVVALVIAATAYSGLSDPDTASKDAPDYSAASTVCGLLTPADLQNALGYRYEDGADALTANSRLIERSKKLGLPVDDAGGYLSNFPDVPGMTRCFYLVDNGIDEVETGVVYALVPAVWRKVSSAERSESVPGIGKRAIWGRGRLLVLTGNKIFGITFHASQEDRPRERAARLGKRAVARMESLSGK